MLRKLRGGRYRIGAELDLHGLRAGEARAALAEFLREARGRGTRCVRIVHGKGRGSGRRGPVLKPLVTDYLARREDVLAFCTARPNDGGSGALYVLLAAPG
ncbi:MAG: hypothetical protein KatS3mg121_0403 [Gammaproteobacteria bacterium]|nr:MAG: hypothetical protein KatS3mg121_0403 [Gammaproteobacteria bacterium]